MMFEDSILFGKFLRPFNLLWGPWYTGPKDSGGTKQTSKLPDQQPVSTATTQATTTTVPTIVTPVVTTSTTSTPLSASTLNLPKTHLDLATCPTKNDRLVG